MGQFYTSASVAEYMVGLSTQRKNAPALEAGYGQGAFLQALLEAGYTNLTGYDQDQANHKFVSKKFGDAVDARCGNYLDSPIEERYKLIIGNPPYVQWNNIDPKVRKQLRESQFWKQYSNGEWDLLYAFIIWSVEKLEDQGELILVVPYSWFNSTYAGTLRAYLADHGRFELLAHFSEYKLFSDCAPNALIFKFRRGAGRNPYIKVAEFGRRTGETDQLLKTLSKGMAKLDPKKLSSDSFDGWRFFTHRQLPADGLWYLATPAEEKRMSRLEKATAGHMIGDHFNVAVGAISGYEKAYSLDAEQLKQIPKRERKLIHYFAKAQSCRPYNFASACPMIFPDAVTGEEQLRKQYPWIYQHLRSYREYLDRRYGAHEQRWWDWATVRNLEIFRANKTKPKVFVPGIDRSPVPRFCLTTDEVYGAGDTVCLTAEDADPDELYYLLGWLNSHQIRDWYRVKGSRAGQRTRYTQAYVSKMPYRVIDQSDKQELALREQIAVIARQLASSTPAYDSTQGQKLQKELDALVERLLR